MSHFIYTTSKLVTPTAEKRINKAVKAIDPEASFYTMSQPGNSIKGVIEVPNDGTCNHASRQADFRKIAAVASEMIDKSKAAR